MKQRLRALSAVAMAPVMAMGLVACGDSGGGTPTTLDIEVTEPGPNQVKFTAPTTSAGGTTKIVLKNSGQSPHDAQLLKVESGKTANDVIQFVVGTGEGAPTPDWLTAGAGVGLVPPGQTGTVTMELDEGTWFIVDTQSGDADDAPSNATLGGITQMQVADGGSDASLPDAAVTVTSQDYTFEVDGDLKSGQNNVRFANDGKEFHHLVAFPLLPGRTVDEFKAMLAAEGPPTGPPPVNFDEGLQTAVIASGQSLVTGLNFAAGKYVFACFISDRVGGPPHAIANDMVTEVTVA